MYLCKELINHPTLKSVLVVGLACFDYSVLFTLPKDQAVRCYSRLFQSFCFRDCLAKELKNIHKDDYNDFVDDLQFVFLDELHIGSEIEDMVTIMPSSPELTQGKHTSYVFKFC